MRRFGFALGLGLLVAGTSLANAMEGQIADRADLLAGPAENFPNVRILPEGAQVDIHGCLKNLRWCDVTWRGKRGWVDGMKVAYTGARERPPVVAFNCDKYWDAYYKSQFFYIDKDKWRGFDATQTVDLSSAE